MPWLFLSELIHSWGRRVSLHLSQCFCSFGWGSSTEGKKEKEQGKEEEEMERETGIARTRRAAAMSVHSFTLHAFVHTMEQLLLWLPHLTVEKNEGSEELE